MKTRFSQLFITCFMVIALIMVGSPKSHSANNCPNWQFQVGGMLTKQYGGGGWVVRPDLNGSYEDTKGIDWAIKAALLLQIPLSNNTPIWLETGLSYRCSLIFGQYNMWGNKFNPNFDFTKGKYDENKYIFDSYRGHAIEIPIKPMYKLTLNDDSAIDFGFGPYASFLVRSDQSPWSAGLNLSVSFRHRCMSYGVEWQNPLFFNGPKNYYKNSFMVTIGINFKGRNPNWGKIAAALDATSSVLNAVNSTLYGSSSEEPDGATDDSQYDSDGEDSSSSSSSSGNYQITYNNWERRAQSHYNTLTNLGYDIKDKSGKHSGGSGSGKVSSSKYTKMKKLLREAQKEMRKVRLKAAKNGVQIQKSQWEDATVSY